MDETALSAPGCASPARHFAGGGFLVAGNAGEGAGRLRRRPTLRETDRLTDALRVTRAVLRRVATAGGDGVADIEAVRSAIEAADAALGGTA
jgi:hypothetical protein